MFAGLFFLADFSGRDAFGTRIVQISCICILKWLIECNEISLFPQRELNSEQYFVISELLFWAILLFPEGG